MIRDKSGVLGLSDASEDFGQGSGDHFTDITVVRRDDTLFFAVLNSAASGESSAEMANSVFSASDLSVVNCT